MTRPQLSREQAFGLLEQAGFPTGSFVASSNVRTPFLVVQVAVAGAESDLIVDAQGPPNPDGTVDRGWLQINSAHGYDPGLLLTDPAYCAKAAFDIVARQGLGAWAAYSRGPYLKRLPPAYGGPTLSRGSSNVPELVKTVQQALNAAGATLEVDGQLGAGTESALVTWKRLHWNDGTKTVDARTWTALGAR